MRKSGSILWVAVAMMSSGCFSSFISKKDEKSERYVLTSPSKGWVAVDPGGADRAYRNQADQAILSISSLCSEDRYRPLESLTEELIKQLPERTVVKPSQSVTVDGQPGLVTEVRGVIDGGDLSVRVAVFRTPSCVYDVLLAGQKLDSSSYRAFDLILENFHERPRP